jgi:hypothetical protein
MQEEELKVIQIGKVEVTSLFGGDMIPYLKDSKSPPKNSDHINTSCQSSRIQNQCKLSVTFLHISNEKIEKETRKTTPFKIASKN